MGPCVSDYQIHGMTQKCYRAPVPRMIVVIRLKWLPWPNMLEKSRMSQNETGCFAPALLRAFACKSTGQGAMDLQHSSKLALEHGSHGICILWNIFVSQGDTLQGSHWSLKAAAQISSKLFQPPRHHPPPTQPTPPLHLLGCEG